jgi:hypothetical protein
MPAMCLQKTARKRTRKTKFVMKIRRYWPLFFILFFSLALTAPACSKKSGCPAEASLKVPKKKKGKTQKGLMSKKMSKKVGG